MCFFEEMFNRRNDVLMQKDAKKVFVDMTLLTGHGNDPPICETRDCRDGDKMLCNS